MLPREEERERKKERKKERERERDERETRERRERDDIQEKTYSGHLIIHSSGLKFDLKRKWNGNEVVQS